MTQEILTYDNKQVKSKIDVNIESEIDGIINYELSEQESEFYKGKIYTGEERNFNINVRSYVNSTKSNKTISFIADATNYIVGENKKASKITYKEISIKEDDFTKVLGDEGFITIKDGNGTVIANITKEVINRANENGNGSIKVDENRNVIIKIPENTYKIETQTSTPISVGKIDFKITKSIIEKEYTQEEIKTFSAIENKIIANGENQTKQILLKETVTKANLEVRTNSLKTDNNDNIQIKVTLLTNDESKDLYKNPKLRITFPEKATSVEAKYKMLYGNGLEIKDSILKEENGRKVLYINLTGEQTTYQGEALDGTVIIVNANITMDKLMTSGKDSIKLEYKNENAKSYEQDKKEENKNVEQAQINDANITNTMKVAKISSIVTLNSPISEQVQDTIATQGTETQELNTIQNQSIIVTNNIKELEVETIGKQEDKIVNLKSTDETKTATVEIGAINNEGENLENVKILGKFPTKNTANTMDITLTSGIQVTSETNNVKVYYTTNENPTDDVENEENGWTQDANLENKNSYLIVIPSFANEESFSAKYGISIVQNAMDSKVASESFKVIYIKENSTESTTVESTRVELKGVNLIQLKMSIWGVGNDSYIKSGLDYNPYLKITNNSNKTLENIKVEFITNEFWEFDAKRSDGLQEDNTVTIEKIDSEETKVISLIANCLERNQKGDYATIYAKVYVDGQVYTSNIIKETIENYSGKVTVEAKSSSNSEENKVKAGDKIDYTIKIENTGTDNMDELLIRDIFPDYININKITVDGKSINYTIEDSNNDKKSISIETTLEAGKTLTIKIETKVKDIQSQEDLEIDNAVYVFNGYKYSAIEVADVFYMDKIIDNSNDGNNTTTQNETNSIENNTATQDGTNSTENNTTTQAETGITPGNTATNDTKNNDNTKETSYKITGKVWLDSETKGNKASSNKNISNVKVKLIDAATGKIAMDKKGIEISAETNNYGEYTLANIEEGKYIVVFDYDKSKYKPTEYQKEGVSESNNSDAILKEILINGVTTSIAATDVLEIKSDMPNIDLGLIEIKNFDLELTKTVSKIVVVNSTETKEYTFNDATLAKVEVDSKKINNSKVSIEYTIKIKNGGEISGYAKNIVDYISSELEFDQNLNKDWYKQGEYIYNKSLANEEIKPGETKEIKLILTKTMTESNTGLISNIAEIAEAENALGISDVDSTPANRKNGEDDMGQADVIIGVKTGKMVEYIIFTFSMLAITGVCVYLINKKVLNEK